MKDIPLYADDVCHIWRMPRVSRMLRAPCKGCSYARTANFTENVCLPKFAITNGSVQYTGGDDQAFEWRTGVRTSLCCAPFFLVFTLVCVVFDQ